MKTPLSMLRALLLLVSTVLASCDGGGNGEGGSIGAVTGATAANRFGGPPGPISLTLQLVTTDSVYPVFLTAPPGDTTRLFIVERSGAIKVHRNGAVLPVPFLDLQGQVASGGEQGLFALAFDPQYAQNRRFYVSYTDLADDLQVVRYRASPSNPDVAIPTPERVIVSVDKINAYHNAGQIAFGPDGYLYVAVGDDGNVSAAQDPNDLLGSLLRFDVRPHGNSGSPSGNPFVAIPHARPEVWSTGLRNPWGFSFDSANGDLYIADVGANSFEEINISPAAQGGGRGANYGWSVLEGPSCHTPPVGCNTSGFTMPVYAYTHATGDCCVIGGYVYRGAAIPALHGTYFFADLCSAWVKSFRWQGGHVTSVQTWPFPPVGGSITAFGQDAAGELYVLTNWGGIYRIKQS